MFDARKDKITHAELASNILNKLTYTDGLSEGDKCYIKPGTSLDDVMLLLLHLFPQGLLNNIPEMKTDYIFMQKGTTSGTCTIEGLKEKTLLYAYSDRTKFDVSEAIEVNKDIPNVTVFTLNTIEPYTEDDYIRIFAN